MIKNVITSEIMYPGFISIYVCSLSPGGGTKVFLQYCNCQFDPDRIRKSNEMKIPMDSFMRAPSGVGGIKEADIPRRSGEHHSGVQGDYLIAAFPAMKIFKPLPRTFHVDMARCCFT